MTVDNLKSLLGKTVKMIWPYSHQQENLTAKKFKDKQEYQYDLFLDTKDKK